MLMAKLILRPHALEVLAQAIAAMQDFAHPADRTLSRLLREQRVGSQDRVIVAEGYYAWLRQRLSVEALAERAAPRAAEPARDGRLLALAALARHFQQRLDVPAGEADRYRKLLDLNAQLGAHERLELPAWLWDRLGRQYGTERQALAQALLAPASLDLRVNTLKAKRETVLARLHAEGLPQAQPTPYAPHGIRIPYEPGQRLDLSRHPLFEDGTIEVQDEGSQLLAQLLGARRGELVVDFCAGAGGKTLALAAIMAGKGRIYAFDTNARRLAELGPRLARSGADNVQAQVIVGEHDPKLERLTGKADRVLVDAPCSGLGTLRRNPDLKWRQSPATIREFISLQSSILAAAARLVRPGGILVYATCSLLAEENQAIVSAFLQAHGQDWQQRPAELPGLTATPEGHLQLLPHRHGCDGFFAAVWQKSSAPR